MLNILRFVYYWLATYFAGVVSFCFYPCRTYGRENIPKAGGCIYASNHESNIDPVLLPVVSPRRIRFLAKDSLFSHPVLGALIRFGGGIPLKRGSADRGALTEVLQSLKDGWPVLIFPQGTRGGEKPQAGVGFLAVKSGVPVVPIFIDGSAMVLPKGARFPKRTLVKVYFGKPLTFSPDVASADAAGQIMQAILACKPEAGAARADLSARNSGL
ncbi:MAG: 1-acyl-sn-glycerol-3-phosphate acyltransferase [Candidatus Omnitrophica bacterium]|nr:1-acyl-sn-glycerol-3-phosphate acyltransferase [Candidatus Omnitrophota bacterium]